MGKRFGNLENKEIIACYVAAYRENGLDDVEFEKNIAQMKSQKEEELVQLSQDLEKLEIANKIRDKDFYRQAMIYLLSNQENISMVAAGELFEKLEQERDKKPDGPYGKIIKALELPKYNSPKPKSKVEKLDEEGQKEEPQMEGVETIEKVYSSEWENDGDIKLQSLKRKYKKGGE